MAAYQDLRRLEAIPLMARTVALNPAAGHFYLDLGLDPFPANGVTTSCDALWMGVPVITMAGDTTFARAGLGVLTNAGLGEFVAKDEQDYVAKAASLALDLPRLAALRRGLRERFKASPMMDGHRFMRHLESGYRQAWRDWCAGR